MLRNTISLPKSLLPNLCGNIVSIHCEVTAANIVFKSETSCSLSYLTILKDELKNVLQEIQSHFNSESVPRVFVTGLSKVWTK